MKVPRPCFFVVRPDTKQTTADGRVQTIPGPIVPLVAVDELPAWLDIAGVPRELTVEEAIGLHNLGIADKSKDLYAVKIVHDATPAARQQAVAVRNAEPKQASHTPVAAVAQVSTRPTSAPSPGSKAPVLATASPVAIHPADRMKSHWSESDSRNPGLTGSIHGPEQPHPQAQQSQTMASPATPGHPVTPATNIGTTVPASASAGATLDNKVIPIPRSNTDSTPSPTEIEYCRHWCQFGTCKFGFECRHLHAMPTTPAELAEVGLTDIPRWYIAETAAAARRHHLHLLHAGIKNRNHTSGHHHLINLGLGAAASAAAAANGGGGGESDATLAGLDPRDVRFSTMRQLGLLDPAPTSSAPPAAAHAGLFPGAGRAAPPSAENRARGGGKKVTTEQVRKAVVLLTELGISVGGGHDGKRMMKKRGREREINPLQKGQGRGARAAKEALLRAARAEMAAASAAAVAGAGGGRLQTGLVVAPMPGQVEVEGDEEGKKEDGEVATGKAETAAAQVAGAQNVGRLVDV